jgi:hypothetical protein
MNITSKLKLDNKNLYKEYEFKKDFFSKNSIKFKRKRKNKLIFKIIKKLGLNKQFNFYNIASKNPNSEIYKLSYIDKKLVLKVEKITKTKNIVKIFNILKKHKLNCKILKPIFFNKEKNYLIYKKNIITLYPYLDGNLFSGNKKQFNSTINEIINTFYVLSKIKLDNKLNALNYFKKNENQIINQISKNEKKIELFFKNEKRFNFSKHANLILYEWKRLRKKKIFPGKKQLVHFDIHPHNLLMKNNKLVGILDLSSLKNMPIGYALSYSFLKILRQHLSNYKINKNCKFLVNNFIKKVNKKLKLKFNKETIRDLAMTEILRRIVIILKKNIHLNDQSLNHIMPVLINNMIECRVLFNEKK